MQKGGFMNPIELGKFLASLRNEKGMTQDELAQMLFIDKRKVSRWECGTSIPDFDILIKLSEIFDVSLYELSICKRLNKGISKDKINRFKNANDLRKYRIKRAILFIILFILCLLFAFTTIYTIKNYNKTQVYELESLDDNFFIKGVYIKTNDYSIFHIDQINYANMESDQNKKCFYEILNESKRMVIYYNDIINKYDEKINDDLANSSLTLNINCNYNGKKTKESFHFKTVNKK